jgi:hypothetical protein
MSAGFLGKIVAVLSSESEELRMDEARSRRKSQKAIGNCSAHPGAQVNTHIYFIERHLCERRRTYNYRAVATSKIGPQRLWPENIRQSFLDGSLTDRLRMND